MERIVENVHGTFTVRSRSRFKNERNTVIEEQEEQICIGVQSGEIQFSKIEQQQRRRNIKIKSLQTFPNEHLCAFLYYFFASTQ